MICAMMAAVIAIVLISDYNYYMAEDPTMVTASGDFEKFQAEGAYKDSQLFQRFGSLSHCDRLFLRDYMASTVLEWKARKPSFYKRSKSLFKQIVVATVISGVVFSASPSKLVKQNTVNYFVSSLL